MTMIFIFSELLFPHYCCSCGQIGSILCESCHNNIIDENSTAGICIVCQSLCGLDGVCLNCRTSFTRAWAVGRREDSLQALINESKYHSCRSGCVRQAALLDDIVPVLPPEVVVVPVPTIQPHVRQRGYGHSELIARSFAKRRNLTCESILIRHGSHVQQGSSLKERIAQAKVSYTATSGATGKTVLLIDDVYTTGSSVRYAAQALKDAGAREVWVAVTARQTLDG